MKWLRKAIADGFRNRALMLDGAELKPLRGRGDFQLLMLDVAMPTDVFAR